MTMKFFLFFLCLLAAINIAMAADTLSFENCKNLGFDCSSEEYLKTNLTLEKQKEYMLSKIMSKFEPPYHDFVRLWNINSRFSEPPEGVEVKSHLSISNAWIITPAIMPSVQENGNYYASEKGIVQTIYNYTLNLPENYYRKDKTCEEQPEVNELEDCRTVYTGHKDISRLNVYQDGHLIGNIPLTSFRSNKTNTFESVLSIKNEIYIDHYKWEKTAVCCQYNYCCWKSGETTECGRDQRCSCQNYEKQCKFSSKGTQIDALELKSNFRASREKPLSTPEEEIKFDASATPQKAIKKINIENLRSYAISTLYQTLKKNFAKYKIGYLYPPQNMLYVYSIKDEKWYTNNAKIEKVTREGNMETVVFLTDEKRLEKCRITAETHFNSTTKACKLVNIDKSKMLLETDKWFYRENETIKLTINLESGSAEEKTVLVNYGNQSFAVKASSNAIETELVPVVGQSLIVASLEGNDAAGGYTSSISVTVYNKNDFTSVVWAVILVTLIYFGTTNLINRLYGKNE